jgi:hypothetical protein
VTDTCWLFFYMHSFCFPVSLYMVDIVSNCIKLDGEERSAGRGLSCAGPVTFCIIDRCRGGKATSRLRVVVAVQNNIS